MQSILIILLLTIGMVGVWHIDITANPTGELTNGFYSVGAEKVYHIGLYLTMAAVIILTIIALREKKKGD